MSKIIRLIIFFLGAILFSSCFLDYLSEPIFPPTTSCSSRVEYYAQNNTSKNIIVDYWVVTRMCFFYDNYSLHQEPFMSFETRDGSDVISHFLFWVDNQDSMNCFVSYQGVLFNPHTVTTIQGCNLRLDNVHLMYYNVYSLDDTAMCRIGLFFPGYEDEEWMGLPPYTMTELDSMPYISYWWMYDSETDLNTSYYFLTVDSTVLLHMQKDYSLLELFPEYYGL